MKGVGYTEVHGDERVWDVADYVFPEQVGDWLLWTHTGPHWSDANKMNLVMHT